MRYMCSSCDNYYYTEQECIEHEKTCGKEIVHKCNKCGKVTTYNNNLDDMDNLVIHNQCHTIDLGHLGYGSKLDGNVKFDLCDDCLCEIYNSLEIETEY